MLQQFDSGIGCPHLLGLLFLVVNFALALNSGGLGGHIAPSQTLADISARSGCCLLGGSHCCLRLSGNLFEYGVFGEMGREMNGW